LAPEYDIAGEAFARDPSVVIAKADCDAHKELSSRFDVSGFPTLKFFPKGSPKSPKPYEGGRTAEDIVNWINNEVGTKARIKKAPSNVVVLTPANFDKIVLDSSKDVLVEFYAPWCGHCKTLAPEYEKLANVYANEPNVVVAKVDADAHKDLGSRYGVQGFPTLKFFSKQSKETPEDYNGGRDIPSFVTFLNDKSGVSRGVDGRLSEKAGRVAALDAIAAKAVAAGADVAALLKEATAVVADLTGADLKSGKIYQKVLETLQSNKDFIAAETARVARLLEGSVSLAKVDDFTIRKNILAAFQA
jgi:protein disulfide-isomerase-like protein